MFKMLKYLRQSVGYIICIVLLLFLQAYCDLSLPDYTSRIVNVGIQQQGIEDGVPDKIRSSSVDQLFLFMDVKEREEIERNYTKEGDIYVRKEISQEERDKLYQVFRVPMLIVQQLSEDNQQTEAIREQLKLPGNADLLQAIGQFPQQQREEMFQEISEQISQMPDSIVTQTAVTYVRSEYEQMGMDVDQIQITYILHAGLLMIGLAFVSMMAAVLVTFLSARVAATLGHNLRSAVYRKVVGFSGAEYNRFSTASLITRSTNDIQQIQLMTAMIFRIALYAPILGIGGVLKVLGTDASMSWIIALAVLLILLVIGVLFKIAMPKFTKLQYLIDRLNLVTREILTGIPVIRAFSREKFEEDRFETANQNLTRTNLFVNRCMTFMMPIMMLIMNGISVMIVFFGAKAVDAGTMQVGNMMAFIQYAMQIIMAFLMICMLSIMLPRADVSAKRINEVLDTKETILDPENPEIPPADVKGEVEFDHVSFAYPGGEEKVLSDISFTARKGQTVAFIGSTGSGKSTLVNLIPRIYDVTEGTVRVDGIDVRKMTQKELRSRLGYVPQKGILFSGTIASNIRYGCPDASMDVVRKAAEIAQATEFVEAKEETYESPIAQGGTNVSGGQKQRLSIARAIAKSPEIFIFDDSFSALDYKTDVVLRRELKKATKEATTLIVAQRISTILQADKIIVLDLGKVVGMGTHRELLKSCEVYRQIAMSQLSEEELANE
ncbi:MAG: ABC transporter ATP-binding protein [Blautia sp.]